MTPYRFGSLRGATHPLAAALLASATLLAGIVTAHGQQTGNIILQGNISSNCNIGVTTTSQAATLPLASGSQHVQVGAVSQNCNKKAGYILTVASANCATGTAGAKLIGATGAETLGYSVEFDNPTTGGSTTPVLNLLAAACSGAGPTTGRSVSNAKISGESSSVWVNYTGSATLGADTYNDTITITMTVN